MASAMPVLPEVASIRVSPGLMRAAFLGAHHHRQRRPVLDRAGRVVAFQLGQDDVVAPVIVRAGQSLQAAPAACSPTKSSSVPGSRRVIAPAI
jgi:hypothetical protein